MSSEAGGFRRLARLSVGYGVGAVVGKGVAILLLPVVTRVLTPADFGRFDLLSSLQSAVGSVLLLGLETGSTRLFPDLSHARQRRMFATWIVISAVATLPVALAMWAGADVLSSWLFSSPTYGAAVALTGLAIVASVFREVGLNALRNHGQARLFAVTSSFAFLLYGALVLVVVVGRPTVTSMMAALTAGLVGGAVMGMAASRRYWLARPEPALVGRLMHFGLPLLPAVVILWSSEFFSRAILLRSAGAEESAWFSLAFRFGSVGVLVVVAFQLAWQVDAFASGRDELGRARVAVEGRCLLALVAAVAVLLTLASPELILLLGGQEYLPALPAVGGAMVFAIAYALYHVGSMSSAIAGTMRDLGIAASVGSIATLALTVALAPRWGSGGTAAAFAAGQFLAVAVVVWFAGQRPTIPYAWGRMAAMAGVAVAVVLATVVPDGGAPPLVRFALGAGYLVFIAVEGSVRDAIGALGGSREVESPSDAD